MYFLLFLKLVFFHLRNCLKLQILFVTYQCSLAKQFFYLSYFRWFSWSYALVLTIILFFQFSNAFNKACCQFLLHTSYKRYYYKLMHCFFLFYPPNIQRSQLLKSNLVKTPNNAVFWQDFIKGKHLRKIREFNGIDPFVPHVAQKQNSDSVLNWWGVG